MPILELVPLLARMCVVVAFHLPRGDESPLPTEKKKLSSCLQRGLNCSLDSISDDRHREIDKRIGRALAMVIAKHTSGSIAAARGKKSVGDNV